MAGIIFITSLITFALGFFLCYALMEKKIPRPDKPATVRQRSYLASLQLKNPGVSALDPDDPELTISQASREIDRLLAK